MGQRYIGRRAFDHDQQLRIGLLLVNLGTPDAPDTASVRRYLREFLWDPRVVELPRPLWWAILHGVILRVRPRRSARAYRSVWTAAGSPLLVHSLAIGEAVANALDGSEADLFRVAVAMSYGQPSIASALDTLTEQGVTRLMVMPLYPQYSATTTGAVFDAVTRELSRYRWLPELIFENSYHDDPRYIEAIAESIREHWREHGQPQKLLFSFHGIPQRYLLAGDPYYCHCQASARLIAQALQLTPDRWHIAFQSRVGREPWLKPYVDETLTQWGKQGIDSVHVICPGFAVDCLETLEEIAQENSQRFRAAGGGKFDYIAALNNRAAHVEMLTHRARLATAHWLDWARAERQRTATGDSARSERAKALGALR